MEDEFFGRTAAQQHGQLIHHLSAADQELVLGRRGSGVAERPAARDDGDLVDRIRVRQRVPDESVTALVVRNDLALLLGHQQALALRSGGDPVDGFLQGGHLDLGLVGPGRQQRALVDHVGEVSAGETGSPPGDDVEVDIRTERLAAGVYAQDSLAAGEVWLPYDDLPVEPARPQQRRVEDVGPVGGGYHDDAALGVETIQFDEQLVQGLLTLVVTAAETGTTVTADGVDLVHEHDGRGVRLRLLEQVAYA